VNPTGLKMGRGGEQGGSLGEVGLRIWRRYK
jgi:hypothetical protein